MKNLKFRLLKADEIECRVGTQAKDNTWVTLLLYKDARVDMRLLDETVGATNWKREHQLIDGQLFCTVSIWDEEKHEWVGKQDVGTESNTEAEKGRSSDSMKRSCFNWGIGRELYSAPFIFINAMDGDVNRSNKWSQTFIVKRIGYDDDGNINDLVIVDKRGRERYNMGGSPSVTSSQSTNDWRAKINACNTREELVTVYNSNKDLQQDPDFLNALNNRMSQLNTQAA